MAVLNLTSLPACDIFNLALVQFIWKPKSATLLAGKSKSDKSDSSNLHRFFVTTLTSLLSEEKLDEDDTVVQIIT